MFITVEGLRGAGKSTITELLADILDAAWMPTVPIGFGRDGSHFTTAAQLNQRFSYCMSATTIAASRIGRVLDRGHDVVAESYFPWTIAHHRGIGATLNVPIPPYTPTPDATFYLGCEEPERQRRLATRRRTPSPWDQSTENHLAEINQEYNQFPAHVIDTTHFRPVHVLQQILHHPLDGGCRCANPPPPTKIPDLVFAIHHRKR